MRFHAAFMRLRKFLEQRFRLIKRSKNVELQCGTYLRCCFVRDTPAGKQKGTAPGCALGHDNN